VSGRAAALAEVLDDASDLVAAVASPWAGLLWLTAVPLRLAQAHFAARLGELGPEARGYGDHLHGLAVVATLAFLLSLWGRAAFARACSQRLRSLETPGREALRLPAAPLASYACAALAIEAAFWATALTLVAVPFLALVAGLAAATSPRLEGPGLVRPFVLVAEGAGPVGPLLGLLVVFGVALLLAAANLVVLVQAGLWLAGGLASFDVARWQGVLGLSNPRLLLVVAAGAWVLVEPWWLASLAVHVHRQRSRSTGEDLRLWFERLRGTAP
jgi:hypothetical protein